MQGSLSAVMANQADPADKKIPLRLRLVTRFPRSQPDSDECEIVSQKLNLMKLCTLSVAALNCNNLIVNTPWLGIADDAVFPRYALRMGEGGSFE